MAGNGCCGAASCGCVITDGDHSIVEGSGSSQDPFRVNLDFGFGVVDNSTFNLTLSGSGTEDAPYALSVAFAPTASVKDFPDWANTAPTNGQVPVWNTSLGTYVPGSPTPAASGSVQHDTSLSGDGSSGSHLQVVHDPDRFTSTDPDGIGLTSAGINRLVRRFANAAARTAASPVPELNAFSALDTAPGLIDYWDGTAWKAAGTAPVVVGGQLLALSGAYAGGRLRTLVKQVSVTTDAADGSFTLLDSSDFGAAAGVLSVTVQPVGAVAFACNVVPQPGFVQGVARRLDTGAVYPAQPIQAVVTALIY